MPSPTELQLEVNNNGGENYLIISLAVVDPDA
jgi:hypothetical protein